MTSHEALVRWSYFAHICVCLQGSKKILGPTRPVGQVI